MKIKILRIKDDLLVDAEIKDGSKLKLPSIHENWRFNFNKHSKDKNACTYVLVTEESPDVIEGCLIYKMRDSIEPYMAYVEIAPHNKNVNRKYDLVAACLISFACRLSFQLGKGEFNGWLAFDVKEDTLQDQHKLMAVYSSKYGAKKFDETTMYIMPKDGEKLIEKYLGK